MHQTKVLTRNSFALGSGALKTLNLDGSYADYQHSEDEPGGTVLTTFKNKEFDSHAELLFAPLGPVTNTALGVEVQHRKFQALGEDSAYLFPTVTQSEAGYLFTELPVSQAFKLQASGRIEHVHVTGTPASDVFTTRSYTPASAAIGALYEIGHSIKLGFTASTTGRAPAITELFARGGHDGPDTYETGDPTLKIERAKSLEATLRVDSGRFAFEGSLYSSWFDNYIYGNLTGRTCDDDGVCTDSPDGALKELNYRQQGAHFRGAEGKAHFDLIPTAEGGLQVEALADYVRATLDDGSNVPRIPPWRFGGGLSWKSEAVDAGFMLIHHGRQDDYGAFDAATPGYDDLGAQVAWRPFASKPGIEFAVVGQNLTDAVQRDAAALNRDVVVMPGRNVRFVVKLATF
jgi:iron complex outermembrane receptor protein